MATILNKPRLLNHIFAAAKKSVEVDEQGQPVLQQFIYALCRENATREQADEAYRFLCEKFFDWNEIRVSSLRELEEAFAGMSDSEMRAERLIAFLQEVFEVHFAFELDKLQKEGLKQAARKLARYQAANDYIVSWVKQRSLDGHAIPVDAPMLRCTARLGLIEKDQDEAEARASLEHLVHKSKGALFTEGISSIAGDYCWEEQPQCAACPLSADCAHAQEHGIEAAAASRTHRAKPR